MIADQPGEGTQLSVIRLAARPKLASLEKLPATNRNIDRELIQRRFEAAIETEADERNGTVPRFRIAMESPSLSLPNRQPPSEIPFPLTAEDGKSS
jgi:hypothetical protein